MKLQGNLYCCDNSGAKKVRIIKVFNNTSSKSSITFGYFLKTVITQCSNKSNKVKLASLVNVIVISSRQNTKRFDSSYLKSDLSSAILLNQKNDCLGSRIFAPIPLELRKKKFLKFIFLSNKIV